MSETEYSSSSDSNEDEDGENILEAENVDNGALEPYQDEPLASHSSSSESENDAVVQDPDGLQRHVLEQRFERTVPVQNWCTCGRCNDAMLVGSMEFRCCAEILSAVGKFTFVGLQPDCITVHPDYTVLSNRVVLEEVGPLLKGKNGRFMRRKKNVSENEFLRAVAYRWIVRWLFGLMGWDNTRPLPACVYHDIRERFPTQTSTGYLPAQRRPDDD